MYSKVRFNNTTLQLCSALGAIDASLEVLCKSLIEAQLPDIINGLVEDNLNPSEVCASIGMCYTPPPSTTAAPAPTSSR